MSDTPLHGNPLERVPPLVQLAHIFGDTAEAVDTSKFTPEEKLAYDIASLVLSRIDEPQLSIAEAEREPNWAYKNIGLVSFLVPKEIGFDIALLEDSDGRLTNAKFLIEMVGVSWLHELEVDFGVDDLPPISENSATDFVRDYLIRFMVNGDEAECVASHIPTDPELLNTYQNTLTGIRALLPQFVPLTLKEMCGEE